MSRLNNALAAACIVATIFLGIGCSSSSDTKNAGEATLIDPNLKLYTVLPKGWISTKFNALYKDAKSPSGYGYLTGGSNMGYGPRNDAGQAVVKVHVIAVPRSSVTLFERNKYPVNAERKLETPDFVIYVATTVPQDPEVAGFVGGLKVK